MNLSNENVIHVNKNGVEYIQFKRLLQYGIKHAYGLKPAYYNTKPGFVSEREYEIAIENYKRLCEAIDCDYNRIIKPYQNHTDVVEVVEAYENGMSIEQEKYMNVDGLITNLPNCILATTNADCILLIIYDPVKKTIANVHSGWKGTFKKIIVNAVNKMINYYGSNPKDIIVCMCPSIRKCHFRVRKDVKEMCEDIFSYTNRLEEIIEYVGKDETSQDSWVIDSILINKIMLIDCGILEENIVDSGICSVCNSQCVHSCRVEGEKYGLCSAVICL